MMYQPASSLFSTIRRTSIKATIVQIYIFIDLFFMYKYVLL